MHTSLFSLFFPNSYNNNQNPTSIVKKQGKGLCFSMQTSYTLLFVAYVDLM